MSLEATLWAMCLAPVPMDIKTRRRNQHAPEGPDNPVVDMQNPNSACALVLLGLANHADAAGRSAGPSVALLQLYTRLSERRIRTTLDRLRDGGVIRPGDQSILSYIPADRRPQVWDLVMDARREDLTAEELRRIASANPMIAPHVERMIERGAATNATGCSDNTSGVQRQTPRGAAAAPEPRMNRSTEPKDEPSTPRKRGTRLPNPFPLREDLIAWARDKAPNAGIEDHERFCRHWWSSTGRNATKLDWDMAWQNWMSTESERRAPKQQKSTPASRAQDALDIGRQLQAEYDNRQQTLAIGGQQ